MGDRRLSLPEQCLPQSVHLCTETASGGEWKCCVLMFYIHTYTQMLYIHTRTHIQTDVVHTRVHTDVVHTHVHTDVVHAHIHTDAGERSWALPQVSTEVDL